MRSTTRWLLPIERKLDLHYITRYQYGSGLGWRVYISRGPATVYQYFFDAEYGTRMLALRAAITFRDETVKKLPPPWNDGHSRGPGEIRLGNRFYRDAQGKRRSYKAYYAWIHVGKNVRMAVATFSVNKYGEEKARCLAVEAVRKRQ